MMLYKKPIQIALLLALLTIVYNVIEGVFSIYFGFNDETLALFGFGLDSFVEVLSGLGILYMIINMRGNISTKNKYENIALTITGVSFYLLSIGLFISSIYLITIDHKPISTMWGIIVSLISILVMYWLIVEKIKIGKILNSNAILADANCTKVCMQLSFVLFFSSLLYKYFQINYIDSIGSFIIGIYSLREGRESFQKINNKDHCC